MKLRKILPVVAIVVVLGFLYFLANGNPFQKESAATVSANVRVEEKDDPSLILVEHPERFPLVSGAERREPNELEVNGSVQPDVARTVHVTSLSGGRVREIHTRLGDTVRKGQLLLVIYSADLAAAHADYRKAQADEVLAREQLERERLLYSHGVAPLRDVQTAQNAEDKANVDVTNAAEHIRILGGVPGNPTPLIPIAAPISGVVVEQNTAGGEDIKSLDNSPSLFTIADLSSVWVVCDVYENDLAQVHLGDWAKVRLNAYPDSVLRGRVANILSILDPNTRTAKVRVELPNPRQQLRPGMFASVLFTSQSRLSRTMLPASALLRLHDRYWVFRQEGGNRFRRVEVHTGPMVLDGLQEILDGLRPGDHVVADALQFSSSLEQ